MVGARSADSPLGATASTSRLKKQKAMLWSFWPGKRSCRKLSIHEHTIDDEDTRFSRDDGNGGRGEK